MSYARGTDWKNLFVAQDDYWVETGRSARGKKTGQQCNARENHGNDHEGHRVSRADIVKQRRQHARPAQRAQTPAQSPSSEDRRRERRTGYWLGWRRGPYGCQCRTCAAPLCRTTLRRFRRTKEQVRRLQKEQAERSGTARLPECLQFSAP